MKVKDFLKGKGHVMCEESKSSTYTVTDMKTGEVTVTSDKVRWLRLLDQTLDKNQDVMVMSHKVSLLCKDLDPAQIIDCEVKKDETYGWGIIMPPSVIQGKTVEF